MLRAGSLNQRVTFLGLPTGTDDWGHPGTQRAEIGQAWANVGQLTGKALIRAGALQADIRLSVRVRQEVIGRLGVVAGMRIRCAGSSYDIEAVLLDIGAREYADLICREGRDDA